MIQGLAILSPERPLKSTTSRCPRCLGEVPAEVVERDGLVFMRKTCPQHGRFEVQLASDARRYYVSLGERDGDGGCCGGGCGCGPSAGAAPMIATDSTPRVVPSSPFDLLPSCIALIEIVDSCNLTCPTCYASSPFGVGDDVDCISFEAFVDRVRGVLDRKATIDILQLSGGEPTIHPRFFEILEWAVNEPRIGYVLVNTNGVRIATDTAFRERLGELRRAKGRFELYLQFDGPQEAGQRELRAADLRDVRERCVDRAGALGVPTTLAMVVTPTTIAHVGDTLRWALARPHVRGITYQPMFTSGRLPQTVELTREKAAIDPALRPATIAPPTPISVADVIRAIVDQAPESIRDGDFTPLPCGDPNCHTIAYVLRLDDSPTPRTLGLSAIAELPELQAFLSNRINYKLEDLLRCGCETEPLGSILRELEIGPDRPLRVFIKPFMDAWTFDQDRIDRCCTHVIRPDGELDSFCRYYLNGGAAGCSTAEGAA